MRIDFKKNNYLKLSFIKSEFQSYSAQEKFSVLCAMVCIFCIASSYTITRPAISSVFIAKYTVRFLPYVWLITIPLNFIVVTLYNRFLQIMGCFRFFLLTLLPTMGLYLFSALFLVKFSFLSLILYIWKDLYIMLMFQQFWSILHSKTKVSRAKYLYGFLFGIGGLGSLFGSLVPGFFATKVGSESTLFFSLPVYSIFIIAYYFLLKKSGFLNSQKEDQKPAELKTDAFEGFSLIRASRVLTFILLVVILMQVSSTLMDYQFSHFLQEKIPNKDLRTQFYGRFWGLIGTGKLLLQFIGSFVLAQFLGVRRSHFLIPAILLLNAIGYLIFPLLSMFMYSFFIIRTFDYSIFNILKEMLYVPLKRDEKFKAKAVIDVFAYRGSKALASILILLLQLFFSSQVLPLLSWIYPLLFSIWIILVFFLLRPRKTSLAV